MSQWSSYGKPDPLVPFVEGRLDSLASVLKSGSGDSLDLIGRMARLAAPNTRLAWSGLAADAFFETIRDIPDDLSKLFLSYGAGHAALVTYISELRRLRSDADAHLEVVSSYEQRITSLRSQLAGVPIDDEAQRRDLEWEIDSHTDSLNGTVRHADVITGALDDAAARFKREMWDAQDQGIHNRSWHVRFYQDHLEVWFESFSGAWEELGIWADVLSLALIFVPGGQYLAAARWAKYIFTGVQVLHVTLKGIDNLLSDDEFNLGFLLEVGMTAIGLGDIAESKGFVSKLGLSDIHKYKVLSRADAVGNVVNVADAIVMEAIVSTPSDPEHAQSMSNLALPDTMRTDSEFADPWWNLGRQTLNQLISTPTVVNIEVDISVTSGRN